MIELKELTLGYGQRTLLETVNARIPAGDETNCRTVFDCIFADNAVVLGADHFPRQYAVGAWHYACGK